MGLNVTIIPCLQDNYAYLLTCSETGEAAVVDPSDAEPVREVLFANGVTLSAILNTHHHWDHTGGNSGLLESFPGIPVYGHVSDRGRIYGQTVFLDTGDTLAIGCHQARIYHIPGHTLGAVAYHVDDMVFTGDTLFAAGCGRLFEGTPDMMYRSLHEVLGTLPGQTKVYCGHEYTRKNLEFARTLEPHNHAIQRRLAEVNALLARNAFTVPSTIALEHDTNPFMRCEAPELLETLRTRHGISPAGPVDTLAAVRHLKDNY